MSCCAILTTPIFKVEVQNWPETASETASESDEVYKLENSFSPMSTSTDVISDEMVKKNNNILFEIEDNRERIQKLKQELKNSSEKISNLIKEKKCLVGKLSELKSNNRTTLKVLQDELES